MKLLSLIHLKPWVRAWNRRPKKGFAALYPLMDRDFPAQKVTGWFAKNRRDLPWRKDYDPYGVLVCEAMAQQTRIDQLRPYYERFLGAFPTVHELAAASEADVLKMWEGLGYYQRARNLHAAAREIVALHGGRVPDSREELLALRGVGPYISAAVLAIAFNRPCACVDGNVLRVASRVWADPGDVRESATRARFERALQRAIPGGQARAFAEGLMELGALVCTPKNPRCDACPLKDACAANARKSVANFPKKSARPKPPERHFAIMALRRENALLLLQREQRLLGGLWELPTVEVNAKAGRREAARAFSRLLGAPVTLGPALGRVRHAYTHFRQVAHVFEGACEKTPEKGVFLEQEAVWEKALPRVQHKALALAQNAKPQERGP